MAPHVVFPAVVGIVGLTILKTTGQTAGPIALQIALRMIPAALCGAVGQGTLRIVVRIGQRISGKTAVVAVSTTITGTVVTIILSIAMPTVCARALCTVFSAVSHIAQGMG